MKKILLIFSIVFTIVLVGCGKTENVTKNMTEEEKTALFNLMQENLEGEWISEKDEILQIIPQNKFLYETNSGLVSLDYKLIDAFNVELTDVNGKIETKDIYFEELEDKYKLTFNKKVYYKNK